MSKTVKGDSNVVAGRDAYIVRTQEAAKRLESFPEFFAEIDSAYTAILNNTHLVRHNKQEKFSSEKLFASLVTIGIPVSIASAVPSKILPLLDTFKAVSYTHLTLPTKA